MNEATGPGVDVVTLLRERYRDNRVLESKWQRRRHSLLIVAAILIVLSVIMAAFAFQMRGQSPKDTIANMVYAIVDIICIAAFIVAYIVVRNRIAYDLLSKPYFDEIKALKDLIFAVGMLWVAVVVTTMVFSSHTDSGYLAGFLNMAVTGGLSSICLFLFDRKKRKLFSQIDEGLHQKRGQRT